MCSAAWLEVSFRPMYEPLIPADVAPDDDVPFSTRFGDVYHSREGALAQSRHVFLNGNGLPQRWRGRRQFTVCETGFGLGINFLAMVQAWREDPQRCDALHMVSIEAHPFTAAALGKWHDRLLPPSLRDLARTLVAQWPPLVPGLHRLVFENGAVTLTLCLGKALSVAPQLEIAADAFFLDGFAPSRNPDMWSLPLLSALADIGAPLATAATWATAGVVRRDLAAAGFDVRKQAGFGTKRHMSAAVLRTPGSTASKVLAAARRPGHAIVIGAGLAGTGVASGLARRGWTVTVIAPFDAPATPGHAAAALTPLVDRDDGPLARLSRAGALCAARLWRGLPGASVVGTVQVTKAARLRARDPQAWAASIAALGLPHDWMRLVGQQEASELAGQAVSRSGLYFPGGQLVCPEALGMSMLNDPAIRRVTASVERVRQGPGGSWQALGAAATPLAEGDLIVLATARGVPGLLDRSGIPWALGDAMQHVAGQISLVPAQALTNGGPRCIVAGEGYVLPVRDGHCVVGSTYNHDCSPAQPAPLLATGHADNLARLRALLPTALRTDDPRDLQGWAGWRAVLPGRLPAIGELAGAEGLWLATGYASRGVTWSALGGEILGARLDGEPALLERELSDRILPDRRTNP